MPTISPERERVVDALDDLLTYAYLYRAEAAAGGDLAALAALSQDIGRQVMAEDSYVAAFLDRGPRGGLERAEVKTLNTLQDAVRIGRPPEPVDFAAEWLNKPDNLSDAYLRAAHGGNAERFARLLNTIGHRLHDEFPPEARPYISLAQVLAVARPLATAAAAALRAPVHLKTLASVVHRAFLPVALHEDAKSAYAELLPDLVRRYMGQAEVRFVDMVRTNIIASLAAPLFERAKSLNISMDRFYSWGTLRKAPLDGQAILDLYAKLANSGLVTDKKYVLETPPEAPSAACIDATVKQLERVVPLPLMRRPSNMSYQNSDACDIQIDGYALQNRAVLIAPYHETLSDLERTLRHFGMYLISQRKRYCAQTHQLLPAEDVAAEKRFGLAIDAHRKPRRWLLKDTRAIVSHMSVFLTLQARENTDFAKKPKKTQYFEISEGMAKNGFRLGSEAIQKANAAFNVAALGAWDELCAAENE